MHAAKIAATSAFVSLFGLFGGAWGDVAPIQRPGALGAGYDAAAMPIYNALQTTPDTSPFVHLAARISLR
jgi:hypothetical protein